MNKSQTRPRAALVLALDLFCYALQVRVRMKLVFPEVPAL